MESEEEDAGDQPRNPSSTARLRAALIQARSLNTSSRQQLCMELATRSGPRLASRSSVEGTAMLSRGPYNYYSGAYTRHFG